jgi:hypothetical protein
MIQVEDFGFDLILENLMVLLPFDVMLVRKIKTAHYLISKSQL